MSYKSNKAVKAQIYTCSLVFWKHFCGKKVKNPKADILSFNAISLIESFLYTFATNISLNKHLRLYS